jgi:hypothetical protein
MRRVYAPSVVSSGPRAAQPVGSRGDRGLCSRPTAC